MNNTNTTQPAPAAPAAGIEFWKGVEHIALIASIIGVVIMYVVSRRKKETRRIDNNPLKVCNVQPRAFEQDCKDRHESAKRAIELLRQEAKAEDIVLHEKIDEVEQRSTDKLANALHVINSTIHDMPEKMLRLLKLTGQLKDHNDEKS